MLKIFSLLSFLATILLAALYSSKKREWAEAEGLLGQSEASKYKGEIFVVGFIETAKCVTFALIGVDGWTTLEVFEGSPILEGLRKRSQHLLWFSLSCLTEGDTAPKRNPARFLDFTRLLQRADLLQRHLGDIAIKFHSFHKMHQEDAILSAGEAADILVECCKGFNAIHGVRIALWVDSMRGMYGDESEILKVLDKLEEDLGISSIRRLMQLLPEES